MKFEKGQVTIEFLLSTIFVIIVLSTLLYFEAENVSRIDESYNPAEVNMESRRMSTGLITSKGSHEFGSGGTKWEKNISTLQSIDSVGLSSDYHVLEREKVENLTSYSADGLNYSRFRELTELENQYRIIFTYLPVVHTSNTFTKRSTPENPNITEPDNSDYVTAGNTVRYGDLVIGNKKYNFLVTSHGGDWDTVYKNRHSIDRWNFSDTPITEEGDLVNLDSRDFTLRNIQDTSEKGGTSVLLARQFNIFGASFDTTANIQKLNRYAVLNETGTSLQPVRMEVFAWRQD